ncbi:hypothetical protein MNBD_NITROSPINAE04-1174 [hydrothermal vent metagenome]|uniref:Roadblock/LAMTOR2 domain-containing protein n=1 Tax=hydrothermal vent metagenome TaxID=652676 RepID=A0A3B1CD71_9ZZZZ
MKNNTEPDGKSSEPKEDYLKTAKYLKKMNELALAIEVCDKGLGKNPNDSNIYILKSQIQIDKFKKDKNPGNLKSALLNLEKALKLNPQSYIARILASQICLKGKAYNKAKSMLAGILQSLPDDEKASSMMAFIVKKEEKKARAEAPPEPKKTPVKAAEPPAPSQDDVIIRTGNETTGESKEEPGGAMGDTRPEGDNWGADDKLVIDSDSDNENSAHLEALSDKLTMFGRLEGLEAIFLVDNNGQLFKSINKSGLDENVIPSLVFNLYKASVMGMRRVGYGSFQRGVLATPIGTIILVNVFYAILTLVVDNDSNLGAVETRIQRYLDEVTQ